MDDAAEAKLHNLATTTLGRSVRAAGQFHMIADTNPRPLEGKSVLEWLFLKTRSRLPAYPYVVVLPDELVMLQFGYSSTIKLRRVAGRWPLSSVKVLAVDALHRQVMFSLPDRRFPAVLEGVYGTSAESDVLTALEDSRRRDK